MISRLHHIYILAICEPMIGFKNINYYKRIIGFHEATSNLNSKIWLFWMDETKGSFIILHPQFLHVQFTSPILYAFGTFVYAHCQRQLQLNLWESLSMIVRNMIAL
ncbi:hypothetical protein KSP39_PZI007746 [Platanthera zijinensis]|uniref:Uncharacterized protein n=1 Tax=Platanthera zijinensis TaxID=2320716 RepID=A0AAP0BNP3_9ASPA